LKRILRALASLREKNFPTKKKLRALAVTYNNKQIMVKNRKPQTCYQIRGLQFYSLLHY